MSVLTSRRLWTFIIAQIVSIASLVIGHYVQDPFALQLAQMIVATVQGLAAIVIVAYTVDDTRANTAEIKADKDIQIAAIQAGSHPDFK
jgi:uncharacterized membrane protein